MSKSNTSNTTDKPQKPYPEFPLYAHATGRWAKKIGGRIHYFGRWKGMPNDGWREALATYQAERDDLFAGRPTERERNDLTVGAVCNDFLTSKKQQLLAGELTRRSFTDLMSTTDRMVQVFGAGKHVADLRPNDFARLRANITERRGPKATHSEITRTKQVFNFAFQNGLIDTPVRYGTCFSPPPKRILRKAANGQSPRMFEPEELRAIIAVCQNPAVKAMVLLGINAGLGNADCGMMPESAVNLDTRWASFPRPKTGVDRRFPLWEETARAIKESLAKRPRPKKGHEGYLFLTRKGARWAKESGASILGREFKKLVERAGIGHGSFYDLRRTFATIGEEAGGVATSHIMGHTDQSMSGVYRQRIADQRLLRVTDHVHAWLFGVENTQ